MKSSGTIVVALEYEEDGGKQGVIMGADSKLVPETEDAEVIQRESQIANKLLEITPNFYLAGSGPSEYFPYIVDLIQEQLRVGKNEDPTIEEIKDAVVLVFTTMRNDSIKEDKEELPAMSVMIAGCGPDGNAEHFCIDTRNLIGGAFCACVDEIRYSAIGYYRPALEFLARAEKESPSSNFDEAYAKVLLALKASCEKEKVFCSPPFDLVHMTSDSSGAAKFHVDDVL